MAKIETLPSVIDIMEQADDSAQKALQTLLKNSLYKKKQKAEPAAVEQLEDLGLVSMVEGSAVFSPELDACKKKVYTYLMRKFEDQQYYDEEMEPHTIPHGAQMVASVSLSGSELRVEFPDDDVTALLDAHGVNRCRGWKP